MEYERDPSDSMNDLGQNVVWAVAGADLDRGVMFAVVRRP